VEARVWQPDLSPIYREVVQTPASRHSDKRGGQVSPAPREVKRTRTLVLCEKPSAAARVAAALDEEASPSKREMHGGVTFFECTTRQGSVVVCSAIGHLYSVGTKGKVLRNTYPVWDFNWKAKSQVERRSTRLAKWIAAIGSLAENADRYVNACDYDIEGSLIGLTILRYACHGADRKASRMKFSTMTDRELREAYRNLSPRLDSSVAEAGRCRHELDWLYGINLSRALTESTLKQRRSYAALSTGRVQGPTLNFVVERELEIESFVPTPYWTIDAIIESEGKEYTLEYAKPRVPTSSEALQVVRDCEGQDLEVESVETREFHQLPPNPFDLPSLQAEAFRHFHYSPSKTLAVAERLYLGAVVSYPRTSSQKLPRDLGYREILHQLSQQNEYSRLAGKILISERLTPQQGPKDDPAHPAIYPTGEPPKSFLTDPEKNLYDLIVRRFMAVFGEPSLRTLSTMTLKHGPHSFLTKASRVLNAGWTEFYAPYSREYSQELPDLKGGERVQLKKIAATEKFVEPPPRYNSNSLLRRMEQAHIGTKATRAETIDTLYKRGYIKKSRIEATPLAIEISRILARHCPLILDPGFTAKLEELLTEIQEESRTRVNVLLETLSQFRSVMRDLVIAEDDVGSQLCRTVAAQTSLDRTLMSPCPQCGSALKIVRSRQSRKRFIGCTGRLEKGCSFSLPLPPFGKLTLLHQKCSACGFQLVLTRSKGYRKMISCARCYVNRVRMTRLKELTPMADPAAEPRSAIAILRKAPSSVQDHKE